MSTDNLDAALTFVIETLEDLSVNEQEPAGVGGISKGGVTLYDYADFCRLKGLPAPTKDTIRNLTEDQIRSVYAEQFAVPLRFAELPSGVDSAVLCFSVQAGITGGIRLLSLATGFWPIPIAMSDALVAHVATIDPRVVIGGIAGAWASNKYDVGNWPKWGHGWSNRVLKQFAYSLPQVKS